MRIGVDIDGTLYPWTQAVNAALGYVHGVEGLTEHTHWDYLKDVITPEQWAWCWSKEAAEAVFGQDKEFEGCVPAVNALIQDGHDVHFVTHRNPQLTSGITAKWIADRFEGYSGLHVLSNKVAKTSLGTWDVFIDDKPDTIEDFLANTDALVLIPDRPWNKEVKGGLRFTDWAAAYHALYPPEPVRPADVYVL